MRDRLSFLLGILVGSALVVACGTGIDGYRVPATRPGKPPPPAQRIERGDIPVDYVNTGLDKEYQHSIHCVDGRVF